MSIDTHKSLIRVFWIGIALIYISVFIALYYKIILPFSEWTISDWLINYEDGGFKRRGLLGGFLFLIQDYIGMKLQVQILLLQILVLSGILFGMFLFTKKYKVDFFYLLIMISPYILCFPALTIRSGGRREILLILLVIGYSLAKKSRSNDVILLLLYLIFLLVHELGFFYLPFLVWVNYLKWNKINFKYLLCLIVSTLLTVVLIYFLGSDINNGESLSILKERGVVFNKENIFELEYFFDFNFVLKHKISFLIHIAELFIIIFQMGYYIYLFKRTFFNTYIIGNVICVLWVAPLFYLGIDWFRWVYIYSSLLFVIFSCSCLEINDLKGIQFNKNIMIKPIYLIVSVFFYLFIFLHLQHDTLFILIKKILT
ncbi:hypothetical protein [Chryseobacterium arachidis]|nr:hypothetical protein [Chryseobacterium arachidis]